MVQLKKRNGRESEEDESEEDESEEGESDKDESDKGELDASARHILYVDDLSCFRRLSSSVYFVMVNNVHGDGRGGASGMPLFNCRGQIIGIYYLAVNDQCFGIHAKTLHSCVSDNNLI